MTRTATLAKPVLKLKRDRPPPEKPVKAPLSERSARAIAISTTRRSLVLRFPNCFKARSAPKLPLKIGICEDILARAPDIDAELLKLALMQYTKGPGDYYRYVIEGAIRVDLDGNAAGVVTSDEAPRHKGK